MNNNKNNNSVRKKSPKVFKKVIGDVEIGEHSEIWFGKVLKGDSGLIAIGRNSNIQDKCLVPGKS